MRYTVQHRVYSFALLLFFLSNSNLQWQRFPYTTPWRTAVRACHSEAAMSSSLRTPINAPRIGPRPPIPAIPPYHSVESSRPFVTRGTTCVTDDTNRSVRKKERKMKKSERDYCKGSITYKQRNDTYRMTRLFQKGRSYNACILGQERHPCFVSGWFVSGRTTTGIPTGG